MHYFVTVLVPRTEKDIEAAVEKILAKTEGKKWDWFQIGGRWTGVYDGYDANKDPKNWETCSLCQGTGTRRDAVVMAGGGVKEGFCNGCSHHAKEYGLPVGKAIKWPTQWEQRSGDIASVEVAETKDLPHSIVTPFGVWHEAKEDWAHYNQPNAKTWDKKRAAAIKEWKEKRIPSLFKRYMDCWAVIVDCHN